MPSYTIRVTTTGSAGSAAGTGTLPFKLAMAAIDAIKVDYHASAPATTDVTITETEGLQQTVLTLTDNKDDGTYYPRHAIHDPTGAAISGAGLITVEGQLQVAVAGCDPLTDAVVVTIRTLENHALR